jgi:hypothetical protein
MEPQAPESPVTPVEAPSNLPTAPVQSVEYPVPVPLRPKPERIETPPAAFSDAAPPRRLGKLIRGLFILVALVIAATGAGAAYLYTASGDGVISDSLANIDVAPKVHIALKLDVDSDTPAYTGASAEVTSEIDRSGSGIPRVQSVISVQSPSFKASIEGKYIDPILYAKIALVPDQHKAFIGEYYNKWYSVSLDTLKQLSIEKGYDVYASTTVKAKTPSEVYSMLRTAHIVGDPQFVGIKNTSKGWVREYSILINKDAIVDYAVSANEIVKLDAAQLAQMRKSAEESMDKVSFPPVIVRTGLMSGTLMEIIVGVDFVGSVYGVNGVNMTFTNDDSQTGFTVSAPPDTISLDEMLLNSSQTSKLKANDARVRALLSSARVSAEVYYDKANSYTSVCTKDANLKAQFAEIKTAGSLTTCKSTAKAYIMTAKLGIAQGTSTASYACVDSVGSSATLSKVPVGYVCK